MIAITRGPTPPPGVVTIPLPDGHVAWVDGPLPPDWEAYHWFCHPVAGVHYVVGYRLGQSTRPMYLHRWLVDAPPGLQVDHINGNPLDNRRANLRVVTVRENQWNQRRRRGQVPYKGVSYDPHYRCYVARMRDGTLYRFLGHFRTAEDAAHAYDTAAVAARGAYAALNFPEDRWTPDQVAAVRLRRPPIGAPRSQSGWRGVYWRAAKRRWRAKIYVRGRQVELGLFATALAAAQAYNAAVDRFGLDPARKNRLPDSS
jgi:hypothetical protein